MIRGGRILGAAFALFALNASAAPKKEPEAVLPAPALTLKVTPGAVWRVQIANTGELPVRIAADIRLLALELTPPASANAKKTPAPLRCVLPDDARPTTDEGSELVVPASRSWSATFDPIFFCFGAKERDALATAGTSVKPLFGWPTHNAKKPSTTAPFAAAPVGAAVGKVGNSKALEADGFALSEATLIAPIRAKSTLAEVKLSLPEALDAARGVELNATITFHNDTPRSITTLLRPEMFLFDVEGDGGSVSCGYPRQVTAPIRELFATIGAKGKAETSVQFSNTCPPDTFDAPGLYRVSARFDSTGASGETISLKTFDGIATSPRPLLVRVRSARHSGTTPRPTLD